MVWLKQIFYAIKYQKKKEDYTCIACITIDPVVRMEKKKIIPRFI